MVVKPPSPESWLRPSATFPVPSSTYAPEFHGVFSEADIFEEYVTSIMNMGNYNRRQVEQALRASNNNLNNAILYLITGIPEKLLIKQGGYDPFKNLSIHPQFQQMRSVIQHNPRFLPVVLEQIKRNSPVLFEAIYRDQHIFAKMLLEPAAEDVNSCGT